MPFYTKFLATDSRKLIPRIWNTSV